MRDADSRMACVTGPLLDPPRRNRASDDGFTLVEVVMAAAILFTVLLAVMSTVSYAANGSLQAEKRQGALNLATFRIEQAHALPYSSVGTTMGALLTGSPAGTLPAVETTNGYTINTTVRYAIDASSHKATYKIVRVVVAWTAPMTGSVTMESAVVGGEVLTGAQVLIDALDLDDASVEVPGVLVTLDPYGTATNQQVTTDANGQALFAAVNTGTVVVNATRSGYLADLKPLIGKSVNNGLNEWVLSLQQASSITVHTGLTDGTGIATSTVSINCTDTSHVAAFTATGTADVNGNVKFPNLWEIKNAGYSYLVKVISPGNALGSVITTLVPMASGALDKVVNIPLATNWLEVRVTDQAAGWDVEGATVTYMKGSLVGTMTATSDISGRAYFAGLTPGLYVFTASKTYPTAPILRTGVSNKTTVTGYNYLAIQTNRN